MSDAPFPRVSPPRPLTGDPAASVSADRAIILAGRPRVSSSRCARAGACRVGQSEREREECDGEREGRMAAGERPCYGLPVRPPPAAPIDVVHSRSAADPLTLFASPAQLGLASSIPASPPPTALSPSLSFSLSPPSFPQPPCPLFARRPHRPHQRPIIPARVPAQNAGAGVSLPLAPTATTASRRDTVRLASAPVPFPSAPATPQFPVCSPKHRPSVLTPVTRPANRYPRVSRTAQ